jgi:hypothetical protein
VFKQLTGQTGKVINPAVGLLIGDISSWELKAREDIQPGEGRYVFRASFSSLSEWMFNDPAIPHIVVVEIGRGQQYRLEVVNDARTVLDGQSLLIEGVNLCQLD